MKCCDDYALALSAFVDGELSEKEKTELLAHLEGCEGCREHLAELMAMHAAFADLEEYNAPDGFAESVMARLHEEKVPKKKHTPRTAWVSIAACAAIVIFAVGGTLRQQFGAAKSAADCAAPEAAMLTMAAPQAEECAEEEYEDEFASVQNAPMMAMTRDCTAPAEEKGKADLEANDYAAEASTELPRSIVFVYGAEHEDYLIELAASFDYYADGTVAGYDLPMEQYDKFIDLLEADGLEYQSSVTEEATTFYVQYEEAGGNG